MRAGSGPRSRRSRNACNGGLSCSSLRASALRRRARRSANLRQPARISFWLAISSGPIRAARRRRCWTPSGRSDRRRPRCPEKSKPNRNNAGMKILRPISILMSCLMLTANAAAQISLTPPGTDTPPAADKPAAKPKAKPPAVAKKPPAPAATAKPAPPVAAPVATVAPALPPDDPNADLVYGAYQRGQYKTAFDLASKRAQDLSDPKAMTMLGELYANAMGVKRDYAKDADWYKRAADGGDREGMFALAMLRLGGRGGPVNREEAVKLLASSAKLGNPKAAYNLALLYLDGQTLPQDLKRSAELLRIAADAGNPEAQYALATFYKEGTGVPKDIDRAVRLLQAASLADNVDAEVEYAIALYNGTGTPKNETAGA